MEGAFRNTPPIIAFRYESYTVNSPPYTFFLLNGDMELNRD